MQTRQQEFDDGRPFVLSGPGIRLDRPPIAPQPFDGALRDADLRALPGRQRIEVGDNRGRALPMASRPDQREMQAVEKQLGLRIHLPEAAQHDRQCASIELIEGQPLHEQALVGEPLSHPRELFHRQQGTHAREIGVKQVADDHVIGLRCGAEEMTGVIAMDLGLAQHTLIALREPMLGRIDTAL